ncbi:hypothetical protein K4F52_006546 [Lecanicillium sp. MT-2017a]|nr:hypothetical protein K4F52_006546 [Lecanicillium sp. MT-2017a]
MKFSTVVPVLGAQAVAADYVCPANVGMSDTEAIVFGYKVQALLEKYYQSVDVDASFFDGLPMADMEGMNGKTNAENMVTNVKGLAKQAMLGGEALKMLGMASMKANGGEAMMPDECDYNMPEPSDGMDYMKKLFFLEATMCGAFIGLSDYVMSPEAAFLMARLSAEHGIHASAIRSKMQDVGFDPESEMLTPAFTPETIMMDGDDMEVGKLGKWLNGCAKKSPMAPCGGEVEIGPMLANLTDQSGNGKCDCSNGGMDGHNGMGGNDGHDGMDMDKDHDNDNGDDNDSDGDDSGNGGGNSPSPTGPAPGTVTGAASRLAGGPLVVAAAVAVSAFLL